MRVAGSLGALANRFELSGLHRRLLTARLHRGDWADLDARLADTKDPVFSREAEAKFEQLRHRIARWERENEADRARLSQGR
jgi:hypothetical protein